MEHATNILIFAALITLALFGYEHWLSYKKFRSMKSQMKAIEKAKKVADEISNTDINDLIAESNKRWEKRDTPEGE
jgi:hypothetical protein